MFPIIISANGMIEWMMRCIHVMVDKAVELHHVLTYTVPAADIML